jgi:thiol-disulfide isomerase/thioredoxin
MKHLLNSAFTRLNRLGTEKLLGVGFLVLAAIVMGHNSNQQSCCISPFAEPQRMGNTGLSEKAAADFALTDLSGKTVRLSDFKGKIVLLDFWATWCAPCRKEIPDLIQLQRQYASRGFTVLGIALDEEGAAVVKPLAQKLIINYPVVIGNTQVAAAYGGIQAVPTTLLIGRDGGILKTYLGAREKSEFQSDIQSALQRTNAAAK